MALIARQSSTQALIRGIYTVHAKDFLKCFATSSKSIVIDESTLPSVTVEPGQAFKGDLRSTSGLGLGDGLTTHTSKWLQGDHKSPMQYIQESEPIKVHGLVVASRGSDDPALGCPIEYINLKGTSREEPAVCKYTGNKYYSDDWKDGGGAHEK